MLWRRWRAYECTAASGGPAKASATPFCFSIFSLIFSDVELLSSQNTLHGTFYGPKKAHVPISTRWRDTAAILILIRGDRRMGPTGYELKMTGSFVLENLRGCENEGTLKRTFGVSNKIGTKKCLKNFT